MSPSPPPPTHVFRNLTWRGNSSWGKGGGNPDPRMAAVSLPSRVLGRKCIFGHFGEVLLPPGYAFVYSVHLADITNDTKSAKGGRPCSAAGWYKLGVESDWKHGGDGQHPDRHDDETSKCEGSTSIA